jgi:hypothetical protein
VDQLKLQLLAKSAICPGIITMIWSLITSNTTGIEEEMEPDDELLEYANYNSRNSNMGEKMFRHGKAQTNDGEKQEQASKNSLDQRLRAAKLHPN